MHSFTYISIPRTGTHSMHTALGTNKKDNHTPIRYLNNDVFSFSLMREPTDRLISWFAWCNEHLTQYDYYRGSFDAWVTAGCPHHLRFSSGIPLMNPLSQWEYLIDLNGEVSIDYIGDFSNIEKHLHAILKKLGRPNMELPRVANSNRAHIAASNTTIDRLKTMFPLDYKLYNDIKDES